MEAAKHNVFSQQTIGGKTLWQMTLHNERAFANCMSPSGREDEIFRQYIWMRCQKVAQAILPQNPLVQLSVRVCPRAYTHFLKVLDQTQPLEAGQEPLAFLGTRGRWTRCIPATSSSGAGKQVVGEKVLEEMEVLEDEGFHNAMIDQRGDTKNTYKISLFDACRILVVCFLLCGRVAEKIYNVTCIC